MIRMLLIVCATTFSFVSFLVSTRYISLNNSLETLNYSLPKHWVVTDIEGVPVRPTFDSKIVEESCINHFKSNLKGRLDSIKLGFYYFQEETLEQTTNRYATGVRISLKADLPFNNSFNKASSFVISKVVQ